MRVSEIGFGAWSLRVRVQGQASEYRDECWKGKIWG